MNFEKSKELYEHGCQFLAGGVSSNFRYAGYGESPVPLYYSKGEGSKLFDIDGNVYIDYALANGPNILGHAPRVVLDEVSRTLSMGQLFAGQTELEVELAKQLVDIVPCAELVRFASSGTEAIQAAVRLARAQTGRSKIIKFEGHYHGWTDNVFISVHPSLHEAGSEKNPNSVAQTLGQSPKSLEDVIVLPWNNIEVFTEVLQSCKNEIAGVVMEPINCNTGVIMPKPGYLEKVREITSRNGIVLIFDEVITGFRVALTGAQGLLGIVPDIAIFAKALAAGFPLSAIVGKRKIMELLQTRSVMHGGTYNANVVAVAAGLATIKHLAANNGARYEQMNLLGQKLIDGLKKLAVDFNRDICSQGLGTVFHPIFAPSNDFYDYRSFTNQDLKEKSHFYSKLQSAGSRVTARGTWFLSTAHTLDDIDQTIKHAQYAMSKLNDEK